MYRKEALAVGEIYHIFNKSIADFKIFNDPFDFSRIMNAIQYYQLKNPPLRLARFSALPESNKDQFGKPDVSAKRDKLIDIIAFCVMPTHLHLVLKQLKDNGISIFVGNVLNSYARYFNTKYKRKGPLWEGRFKNVLVKDDEQLLHLTRYLHLNPVTAYLVDNPEDWPVSSYKEYTTSEDAGNSKICSYDSLFDISPDSYAEFVKDNIAYQRELAGIEKLIVE